jgi:hypothetical protein
MTETITCPRCQLVARRIVLDERPSLQFDIDELEERCIASSCVPEPFRCPHLLSAGMDGGWIARPC